MNNAVFEKNMENVTNHSKTIQKWLTLIILQKKT